MMDFVFKMTNSVSKMTILIQTARSPNGEKILLMIKDPSVEEFEAMELDGMDRSAGGSPGSSSAAYCTFYGHLFLQCSIEHAERLENCP